MFQLSGFYCRGFRFIGVSSLGFRGSVSLALYRQLLD